MAIAVITQLMNSLALSVDNTHPIIEPIQISKNPPPRAAPPRAARDATPLPALRRHLPN